MECHAQHTSRECHDVIDRMLSWLSIKQQPLSRKSRIGVGPGSTMDIRAREGAGAWPGSLER